MSPALVDAFLLKEDRWFYWHPGVNPIALARAAFRTYRGGARRAARRSRCSWRGCSYRLNTQTPAGKLRQIGARAVARGALLEARAARGLPERRAVRRQHRGRRRGQPRLLRQAAGRVTLGEALTLAVIPQRPASRAGRIGIGSGCWPRARGWRRWLARHGDSDADRAAGRAADRRRADIRDAVAGAALRRRAAREPRRARPAASTPRSTPACSAWSSGRSSATSRSAATVGIRNAAALLVDTRDMAVQGVGRVGRLLERRDRRPGQRRARRSARRARAEAVRLRARARSGRAASADDAARRADVVRPVHAGELRRPVLRPDHAPRRR